RLSRPFDDTTGPAKILDILNINLIQDDIPHTFHLLLLYTYTRNHQNARKRLPHVDAALVTKRQYDGGDRLCKPHPMLKLTINGVLLDSGEVGQMNGLPDFLR